jgi:WD40 repeat protein
MIRSIDHDTADPESVAFSRDGNLLAAGGQDGSARIWNVATGMLVRTVRHYEPPKELPRSDVSSVAFSPDGNILATVGWDGNARLWNAESGSLVRVLPVGVTGYWGAFSPDGRLFATSGDTNNTTTTSRNLDPRPGKIRLWEVETGRLIRTLEGHSDAVHYVSFSPDGALLVSGGDDDTVRLWAVADGDLLDTVLMPATPGFKYGNVGVAFFPDGKSVLTASGAVRVWSIVH